MTDTPTASRARPLSPHLQIYRWQLPMTLSISHRITGIGLAVGTLVLAWWVIAAATGPDAFATAQSFLGSALGRLLLFGWTVAFYFHALNGVRHLLWDTVHAIELPAVYRGGWAVLVLTLVLTLVTWLFAYGLI
jgi:succinate dehydrogenase / fumarate reductase cytochrome b subunit